MENKLVLKEVNNTIKILNDIPDPCSVDGIIKIFESNSKSIINNFAIYFYKEGTKDSFLWYDTDKDKVYDSKYLLISRGYEFGYICIDSHLDSAYLSILVNHLALILYSEKLSFLANRDKLTKVYNRGYILKYLKEQEELKKLYSIVIIDLDKFKHYNDSYGHNIGDHILKRASKVMKESIKQIEYKSILARYGGEEFILVLDIQDKDILYKSMEIIRNNISNTDFSTNDYSLKATASLGGSIRDYNYSLEDFIDTADKALYSSKKNGRNKSTIF